MSEGVPHICFHDEEIPDKTHPCSCLFPTNHMANGWNASMKRYAPTEHQTPDSPDGVERIYVPGLYRGGSSVEFGLWFLKRDGTWLFSMPLGGYTWQRSNTMPDDKGEPLTLLVEDKTGHDPMKSRSEGVPPWEDHRACWGHCDPEGWYSPCKGGTQHVTLTTDNG